MVREEVLLSEEQGCMYGAVRTLSSDTSISEDPESLPDLIVHPMEVVELRGPPALLLRFICRCVLPRCDKPVHHRPLRNGWAVDP